MFKNALLPTLLSLGFYTFLSFRNPITTVDDTLLTALGSQFRLSLWLVVPAVIMLILPVFKVPIRIAMAISAGAAFLVTLFLQDMSAGEALKVCLLGYHPDAGILTDIVSGGGLISMETPFIMLPLASLYTGILEGTGALENVQALLRKLSNKLGLLPAMNIVSILAAAVLCNQTIVIIMTYQVMAKVYEDEGASKEELAMDIANSGVTISGLVPWCIACSVPLSMLEVGPSALPYACLLYLIPICYLFTKRFFYPEKKNA